MVSGKAKSNHGSVSFKNKTEPNRSGSAQIPTPLPRSRVLTLGLGEKMLMCGTPLSEGFSCKSFFRTWSPSLCWVSFWCFMEDQRFQRKLSSSLGKFCLGVWAHQIGSWERHLRYWALGVVSFIGRQILSGSPSLGVSVC